MVISGNFAMKICTTEIAGTFSGGDIRSNGDAPLSREGDENGA